MINQRCTIFSLVNSATSVLKYSPERKDSLSSERKNMKRRANNTGTLICKPNGLLIAKWEFAGRTYTRSTQCYATVKDGRKQALKKLEEFVKPFLEQSNIAVLENLAAKVRTMEKEKEVREQRHIQLVDMYSEFISDVNLSSMTNGTKDGYRTTASLFVKWLRRNNKHCIYLEDVTKEIAQEYLLDISKECCVGTYNNKLSALCRMYKALLPNGNVFSQFKKKRNEVVFQRRALTHSEVEAIFENAKDPNMRLLFTIGFYTGARLSDCCLLKWENVKFDEGVIQYTPLKTKRLGITLTIPIHRKLLEVLKSFYSENTASTDYISGLNAKLYLNNVINNKMTKFFWEIGLKSGADYIGFHCLRHTFVSMCSNKGIPLLMVQKMVGHCSKEMTERYYHMDLTIASQAIQSL